MMRGARRLGIATLAAGLMLGGSSLADDAMLSLSKVSVSAKKWSFGDAKGKFYLRVQFTAKVAGAVPEKGNMKIHSTCKVGSETTVDDASVLGAMKLREMKAGESTGLSAILYGTSNAMDKKPDGCTLVFNMEDGYGKAAKKTTLHTVCFKGKGVKDGECP